jgi:hypothetical protein
MNQGVKVQRKSGISSGLGAMAVLWSLAFLLIFGFWWFASDGPTPFSDYYLVPWTVLTAAILLAPSFILYRRGQFDLFHPLVFGAWSYLIPAFVIGAVIITAGLNEPYFFNFIESPNFNLPLSLVYICLGFLGMCAGFAIPHGKRIGAWLRGKFSGGEWGGFNVWLAGGILLFAGVGINIIGFVQGLLGYQKVSESAIFDGLIFFLSTILTIGFVLLWATIFKQGKLEPLHYVVMAVLVLLIPFRMALLGNRGGLLAAVVPIGLAFAYSGRKLKVVHGAVFGVLVFLALIIGVLYGTAFRQIKGSEERIAAGAYIEQVGATLEYIGRTDISELIAENARTIAARFENLSSLAVVVSNHERLAPFEAAYGLENNILNDLSTSLIPRFVWSDKPPTTDPRAYSDLYFNFGDNSFAITPFGDLLRNFGVVGIPLGMLLIGFYFRVVYAFLIEGQTPTNWGIAAYFPLLSIVSYEGFYSTFIPSALRVAVVILIPLVVIHFLFFRRRISSPA